MCCFRLVVVRRLDDRKHATTPSAAEPGWRQDRCNEPEVQPRETVWTPLSQLPVRDSQLKKMDQLRYGDADDVAEHRDLRRGMGQDEKLKNTVAILLDRKLSKHAEWREEERRLAEAKVELKRLKEARQIALRGTRSEKKFYVGDWVKTHVENKYGHRKHLIEILKEKPYHRKRHVVAGEVIKDLHPDAALKHTMTDYKVAFCYGVTERRVVTVNSSTAASTLFVVYICKRVIYAGNSCTC